MGQPKLGCTVPAGRIGTRRRMGCGVGSGMAVNEGLMSWLRSGGSR